MPCVHITAQQSSLHQHCFRCLRERLSVQIYQAKKILFLILIFCYAAVVCSDKRYSSFRTVIYNFHLANFLLHFKIDRITLTLHWILAWPDMIMLCPCRSSLWGQRIQPFVAWHRCPVDCYSRIWNRPVAWDSSVWVGYSDYLPLPSWQWPRLGGRRRTNLLDVLKNTTDGVGRP